MLKRCVQTIGSHVPTRFPREGKRGPSGQGGTGRRERTGRGVEGEGYKGILWQCGGDTAPSPTLTLSRVWSDGESRLSNLHSGGWSRPAGNCRRRCCADAGRAHRARGLTPYSVRTPVSRGPICVADGTAGRRRHLLRAPMQMASSGRRTVSSDEGFSGAAACPGEC